MKKFIQTDSGRTLLETILVISLIGLLSMAGLYGYQVAVAKSEAQGINKQVAAIVQERRHLLIESGKGDPMPQKIPGPYGIGFHVENGFSGSEEDYFSISFTVKGKRLCEEVVKSQFISPSQITINGALNNNCEENASIALWFQKSEGVGDGMNTYTEGGKTYICPMNATCSNGGFRCNEGYYKVGSECVQCPSNTATCTHEGFTCPEGYRKTEANCLERVNCDYPATACDEDGNPTACADKYYLKNNKCEECPENATACDSNGKATECETGYCLHNGVCDELPDNATCTTTGFNCNPNYYKDGNECKQCPENTQTCSGESFTCMAGYYKNDDTCTQCGDREISVAGATECTTCTTPGKTNNATHTDCTENCEAGDPNCGCTDPTPYADGNGGCMEERTCTDNTQCGGVNSGYFCYYSIESTICELDFGKREKSGICRIQELGDLPTGATNEGFISSKKVMDWYSARNFCQSYGKEMATLEQMGLVLTPGVDYCSGYGTADNQCHITSNDWLTIQTKFGSHDFFWVADLSPNGVNTSCGAYYVNLPAPDAYVNTDDQYMNFYHTALCK